MKHHQVKKGFVLVEWMVQFLLLTILSIVSYSLITMWYTTILRTNRLIADLLPVYLATDIMRSDIAQGDPERMRIEGNKLYLMHDHKQIQWYFNEQKLFRTSGSYDQQQKRWRKPAKSLVASKIRIGTFSKQNVHDKQIGIKLQSIHQPKMIEQVVSMRNGSVI